MVIAALDETVVGRVKSYPAQSLSLFGYVFQGKNVTIVHVAIQSWCEC